jgi:spermidine synthase
VADTLSRLAGAAGELVLRRSGPHFEIIANGMFLMDTRDGTSERLLATAAADRMPTGGRMLIGGLGVGFSLRAALDHPRVGGIVVLEREPAVITWNHGPLRELHGDALSNPRVRCVPADLVPWLRTCDERFAAVCLDIDNGPEWTVSDTNAALYSGLGLDSLAWVLQPNGVLAVWSASASESFAGLLRARFTRVEVLSVPVSRGEPDVVFLASTPRPAATDPADFATK